jgi:hypothetical protein
MRFPFLLLNHLVNPLVKAILRSPAHRLLSGRLVVIEIEGRRSHRRFSMPAGYEQTGPATLRITVGAPEAKVWWRNLLKLAPVAVRLRGEHRAGVGRVEREGATVHVLIDLDAPPATGGR